jgi:hypothetical protein
MSHAHELKLYAMSMEDEPEDLNMSPEGIARFVQYYANRVMDEESLPDLEWYLGNELQYVYFWLKSEEFEEPIKVPLNIRRATQPLEDMSAIRKRIYTSFSDAARRLANRRAR